eukprot:51785-Chlamydomonas_euryale.AAC.1
MHHPHFYPCAPGVLHVWSPHLTPTSPPHTHKCEEYAATAPPGTCPLSSVAHLDRPPHPTLPQPHRSSRSTAAMAPARSPMPRSMR